MYTIKSGSTIVYDQSRPGQWPIIAPRISQELNQAGEFQFLLIPNGNSFYDTCEPLATYLSVEDDGDEVFYGRVLTRSDPIFKGQVTITCEGVLSFLTDAQLPPDEKVDGKQVYQTQTAEAFFRRCIEAYNRGITHNGRIDTRRQLSVGTVSHPKSAEQKEYRITSYVDIRNAIENQLLDEYGGYIRIRKSGSGHVIDWLDAYHDVDPQPITVGENIIDQTNKITGENIFTVLLPVGKDGLTLKAGDGEWVNDDGTVRVFYNADITGKYGKIIRVIQFSDQDTAAGLYAKTAEYINKLNYTLYRDAEIKLVDFHYINGGYPKLRLGSAYTHVEGFNEPMALASLEIALENPADGTLTLKNAKELESEFSGLGGNSSANSNSRSLSGGIGGSYGPQFKYIHEFDERLQLATKDISINAERLTLTSNELISLSRKTLGEDADAELEDSILGMIRQIQGTGIFQDSDKITELAGKWTIDEDTGNLILNEGSELVVSDQNGTTITVGENLGTIKTMVNGHETFINDFQGSALWTQKDNITGFVGNFDVETDANGKKKLVIKDGAGLVIRDGETEHGVYTDGNLDAGIIISKLNGDGGASTTIKGDLINLSGNDEFSTVQSNVTTSKGWIDTHGGPAVEALEGSQILQNSSKIIDTVGEFEVTYDTDGKPQGVTVINGSTFQLRRDNTLWGVYDQGNLTGGIIINKINTVDGTQTGMKIKADVLDIKVPEINLDGTEIINVINENDDSLTINANKVNLSGFLKTSGLGAAFTALHEATIDKLTVGDIYLKSSDMGAINLGKAFTAGVISSNKLTIRNPAGDNSVSFAISNDTMTITDQYGKTLTFKKASTLTGKWTSSTRYEANAGDLSVTTNIDGWERTGVEANGKILKVKYNVYFDEFEGPSGTDYKNVYQVYDQSLNAAGVYDNGWKAAARTGNAVTTTPGRILQQIKLSLPNTETVDGAATGYIYRLRQKPSDANYIELCYYVASTDSYTPVAQIEHKVLQTLTAKWTSLTRFSVTDGTQEKHTQIDGWERMGVEASGKTLKVRYNVYFDEQSDGSYLNTYSIYDQNVNAAAVYDNGWKTAAGTGNTPITKLDSGVPQIKVSLPNKNTVDGAATGYVYRMRQKPSDSDYVELCYVDGTTYTPIVELRHVNTQTITAKWVSNTQFKVTVGDQSVKTQIDGWEKVRVTAGSSNKYVNQTINVYFDEQSGGTYLNTYPIEIKDINASSVYDNGWKAAAAKVSPPTTANTTTDNFSIAVPSTTTSGANGTALKYTVKCSSAAAYVINDAGTIVCRLAHSLLDPTQLTVSQFYGTTEADAKANGYTKTTSDITQSTSVAYYAFNVSNKKNFYFKVTSTAVEPTVTLRKSWNETSGIVSSRTLTVTASGLKSNPSTTQTIHLTVGVWEDGFIPIYIKDTSTNGSTLAENSVSLPAVTNTTWTNTTGNTWRADLTIGGVTRSSTTKDFTPTNDKITVSQFYGTTEASAKQSGFVRTPTDITLSSTTGWYAFAVMNKKNFYFKVTSTASDTTTITVSQFYGTTEASAKQSGFVRTPTDIVQTTAIGWYAFAVNDRKNFYFKVTADGSSSTTKTYEQGWRAAANKVVPPTNANTETDTFSIEVPSKTTVDANGTALKYTIKLNKMAAYVINNAGTIVCRLANDTYNQGWSDYYHDSGNFMKSWACTSSTTDSTGYSCTAGKHYCTRPTSTPGGWQVWFCWEDEMESYVPETPKASGLSIGSISYVSGSGYSNWVSGKGNVTDLGRVTTLAKQNSQGYVVFRITHSGMTGAKWCRVPTVN